MKYLQQKPNHLWWTKNPRYFIYFLREFSGVLIAFYILGILYFGQSSWLTWIGLTGAIIHTLTWLYVMPRLLPFKLSKMQQKVAYVLFLGIWLAVSYGIFRYL